MLNDSILKKYMNDYEENLDSANFRLYYENHATSFIWYEDSILYIPQYFLQLNSLINCKPEKIEYKLTSCEQNLLDDLYESGLEFKLQENIAILYSRLRASGLMLDIGLSVTFNDDNDYSQLSKPIYLGNKKWINR